MARKKRRMRRQKGNPTIGGKQIPWSLLALIGASGWWWWREHGTPWRKLPENSRIEYAMKPIQAESGKLASLQTYRLIENRRDGMTYAPVTSEESSGVIFTMPKAGTITRNVLVEGGGKYVEVA